MTAIQINIGKGDQVFTAYDLLRDTLGEGHTLRWYDKPRYWEWKNFMYLHSSSCEEIISDFLASDFNWSAMPAGISGIILLFKNVDDALVFRLTWN